MRTVEISRINQQLVMLLKAQGQILYIVLMVDTSEQVRSWIDDAQLIETNKLF